MSDHRTAESASEVSIPTAGELLGGILDAPHQARGVILFAHGSGSSRWSPRNTYVARQLRNAGMATLLFDLLTASEEQVDSGTAELRFDIPLLTERLLDATRWVRAHIGHLPIGYFGASTGAAAALCAAAQVPDTAAVVSRGGRPDLAASALEAVSAPTLLVVGERDPRVLQLNRQALAHLKCEARLEVVPGATHLFEEPGALERVARLASDWFSRRMPPTAHGRAEPKPLRPR